MNLFENNFLRALGVGAFVYLFLQAFGWGLESLLSLIESFSRWYRYIGRNWIEEISLAASAGYLLFSAVINSK